MEVTWSKLFADYKPKYFSRRHKSAKKHLLQENSFPLTYIREYGSTLYVGLARAVSPTNTNFRLTFLLTRLQEALYEDLAV